MIKEAYGAGCSAAMEKISAVLTGVPMNALGFGGVGALAGYIGSSNKKHKKNRLRNTLLGAGLGAAVGAGGKKLDSFLKID